MTDTKQCTKCREVKPLEAFAKRSSVSTKRVAECKTCMAQRHAQWRQANPEKARDHHRRWAQAHAEQIKAKAAANRGNRREYMREYMRERRAQEAVMTLNEAQVQVLTEMKAAGKWRMRLEPEISAAVRALVKASLICRDGPWDYTLTEEGRRAVTAHQQAHGVQPAPAPEPRYYECRRCHNVLVHTRGGRLPHHCPDCRKVIASEPPLMQNTCVDCHTSFPAGRKNHQRCPVCSRNRALDLMAVTRARRAGSTLPKEQLMALAHAKREMTEAVSNARRQAYERYEALRQRVEQS